MQEHGFMLFSIHFVLFCLVKFEGNIHITLLSLIHFKGDLGGKKTIQIYIH